MELFIDFLRSPFAWGLALGLLFFGFAFVALFKTKGEFRRYKKMLSDKMELEAEQASKFKGDRDRLTRENENLRLKLGQMGERSDAKIERELEILARAEKSMMINAPGFAGAWEMAKSAAAEEVADEEGGRSIPKRIFRKFFGGGAQKEVEALPVSSGDDSSDRA
jgi:hypothetical protein